jgi:hypothetical protein
MSSSDRSLQQQQQRNDKKHRKLVRSPEKLSPCDFDSYPISNPSLLSASKNVFSSNPSPLAAAPIPSSNNHHRSSPTKSYNDQFPPPLSQQQVWLEQQQQHHLITIPPSSSAPSIALHRKPSITIKYSKDEDIYRQQQQQIKFSKFESSADQMSNNNDNFLINFAEQQQNLSPFNYDEFSSSNCDIYQQLSTSSPTSASPYLNLTHQTHFEMKPSDQQIVFNSNNPFLSDNFDAIVNSCDANSGGVDNFFTVDDSELLFLPDDELKQTKATSMGPTAMTTSFSATTMMRNDGMETQLLRNKHENFSKFCLLVVSPPSNKLLQVSVTIFVAVAKLITF